MPRYARIDMAIDLPDIAAPEETGSLGVMHLKRFWSRTLAERAGKGQQTASERVADKTLLYGIHAGIHETLAFLMQNAPTFGQFEAWVLEINGGWLDPVRVTRINAALAGSLDRGMAPATGSADAALTARDLVFWDQNGYVVLRNAVTADQCRAAAQAIYEFLGADPSKPETWYNNPAGHTIWVSVLRHPAFLANRESRRIHSAFAQLWGRTDLWTSVDQGGFNPPERAGWPFPGPHLHWDESIAEPVPLGMAGILYLTDTASDQGAFRCVPGFHRQLARWLAELPPDTDPRDHRILNTLPAVAVAGSAGDLVIWHQGLPHGSSPNRSNRPRVVQYLTMLPSRWDFNPVWR